MPSPESANAEAVRPSITIPFAMAAYVANRDGLVPLQCREIKRFECGRRWRSRGYLPWRFEAATDAREASGNPNTDRLVVGRMRLIAPAGHEVLFSKTNDLLRDACSRRNLIQSQFAE